MRIVVLNGDQQSVFNDYLRSGGGYIGVHSASDCLQNTPFYNQTVGAIFDYHPPIQEAVRASLSVLYCLTQRPCSHSRHSSPLRVITPPPPTFQTNGDMYVTHQLPISLTDPWV